MDKIGIFKGKPISTMTREELLDFAEWAGRDIERLTRIEYGTQDYRINKEVMLGLQVGKEPKSASPIAFVILGIFIALMFILPLELKILALIFVAFIFLMG